MPRPAQAPKGGAQEEPGSPRGAQGEPPEPAEGAEGAPSRPLQEAQGPQVPPAAKRGKPEDFRSPRRAPGLFSPPGPPPSNPGPPGGGRNPANPGSVPPPRGPTNQRRPLNPQPGIELQSPGLDPPTRGGRFFPFLPPPVGGPVRVGRLGRPVLFHPPAERALPSLKGPPFRLPPMGIVPPDLRAYLRGGPQRRSNREQVLLRPFPFNLILPPCPPADPFSGSYIARAISISPLVPFRSIGSPCSLHRPSGQGGKAALRSHRRCRGRG